MRTCRLKASFSRRSDGGSEPRTPEQVVGDVCHGVLEHLVRSKSLMASDWEGAFDLALAEVTDQLARETREGPHANILEEDPERWPGYRMKVARLKRTSKRLHELLSPFGLEAEYLTEEPMSGLNGRIRGRPDLIVRGSSETWVIDYKSGRVLEEEGIPRESYVRQLQLYAMLESETNGRWPSRAYLIPLNGSPVDVAIDEEQTQQLAKELVSSLEAYNETAPAAQPGSPSPEICRYCPYAAFCPAFWNAYDTTWEEHVRAVAGRVRAVTRAEVGVRSLVLESATDEAAVAVERIAERDHPAIARVQAGSEVRLVGLRPAREGKALTLPRWGRLAVFETRSR